jgi:hypothetical protein
MTVTGAARSLRDTAAIRSWFTYSRRTGLNGFQLVAAIVVTYSEGVPDRAR